MSRQLKPQIVDEASSPNGHVKLPIFFDRNEKDFYVEVTGPDDRVRADSVSEVKKLARELLTKVAEYKWEGIIAVEVESSYETKQRSKHPTHKDRFVYRKHTVDFEANEPQVYDRKRRAENLDLQQWGVDPGATVLPYGEETWQGLLAMKKAVDAAQAQLEALVERKDLAEKLRLIGKQPQAPMLPAAAGSERSR